MYSDENENEEINWINKKNLQLKCLFQVLDEINTKQTEREPKIEELIKSLKSLKLSNNFLLDKK